MPEGDITTLNREPSARLAAIALVGIAAASALLRIVLVTQVKAPTVFSDEIGYEKLAQSIGLTGRLALFDNPGLSYSPLYPALLAPIYAFGASAPTAYAAIKIVNAVIISLSVFPIYKIARFAVPRRLALVVAALSVFAPLMFLSSFSMSENLAYPVCLVAIWTMLHAVARPSARHDAALLAVMVIATCVRVQLVVLLPTALTAIAVASLLSPGSVPRARSLLEAVKAHVVLFAATGVALLVAGALTLAGADVLAVAGRYSNVGRRLPNAWSFAKLLAHHLAGIDLAVGVVPFVAAIVITVAFLRSRRLRAEHVAFAAVALSVTAWLLVQVAYDAALFDSPNGDIPRIHERFLIYLLPLFLTALAAAYRYAQSKDLERVYLAAAGAAALLPAVIPFDVVINDTISFESLSLEPLGRSSGVGIHAVPHATLMALWIAALLALFYVRLRHRLRSIILLVLLPFVAASVLARVRIEDASTFARSLLPAHADWVDRTKPSGDVVLLSGGMDPAALETAYANLSIDRLYAVCGLSFGSEFGEVPVTVDRSGVFRAAGRPVRAAYVVAPASFAVQGRVVAWNQGGSQVLVVPTGGRVSVPGPAGPAKCS